MHVAFPWQLKGSACTPKSLDVSCAFSLSSILKKDVWKKKKKEKKKKKKKKEFNRFPTLIKISAKVYLIHILMIITLITIMIFKKNNMFMNLLLTVCSNGKLTCSYDTRTVK